MKTTCLALLAMVSLGCASASLPNRNPTHPILICFPASYNGAMVTVCMDKEDMDKLFDPSKEQTRVEK